MSHGIGAVFLLFGKTFDGFSTVNKIIHNFTKGLAVYFPTCLFASHIHPHLNSTWSFLDSPLAHSMDFAWTLVSSTTVILWCGFRSFLDSKIFSFIYSRYSVIGAFIFLFLYNYLIWCISWSHFGSCEQFVVSSLGAVVTNTVLILKWTASARAYFVQYICYIYFE